MCIVAVFFFFSFSKIWQYHESSITRVVIFTVLRILFFVVLNTKWTIQYCTHTKHSHRASHAYTRYTGASRICNSLKNSSTLRRKCPTMTDNCRSAWGRSRWMFSCVYRSDVYSSSTCVLFCTDKADNGTLARRRTRASSVAPSSNSSCRLCRMSCKDT